MIKHVVLILLLTATPLAYAQVNFPVNESGEVEFVKIIQVDSSSKEKNFTASRLWVANAFNSAKDVIQYENKEEGKLICKGLAVIKATGQGMNGTIHRSQAGNVFFTLEISVKDDRCRIRVYDLQHQAEISGGKIDNLKPASGTFYMTIKTWNSIQKQTIDAVNDMIADYEVKVNRRSDDW